MATRAPPRENDVPCPEHETHHALLDWAEEWAEETGLAAPGEPGAGVPWHFVLLVILGLALLFAAETALVFGIAKLVTGQAY